MKIDVNINSDGKLQVNMPVSEIGYFLASPSTLTVWFTFAQIVQMLESAQVKLMTQDIDRRHAEEVMEADLAHYKPDPKLNLNGHPKHPEQDRKEPDGKHTSHTQKIKDSEKNNF